MLCERCRAGCRGAGEISPAAPRLLTEGVQLNWPCLEPFPAPSTARWCQVMGTASGAAERNCSALWREREPQLAEGSRTLPAGGCEPATYLACSSAYLTCFPRPVPRSSWTNKLIPAKDHGSIQLNIGHLDEEGVYKTGQYTTFALHGTVRATVRTPTAGLALRVRGSSGVRLCTGFVSYGI